VLLGNCQAERHSGVAVVVAGAAEPDQLGRDGIQTREPHDRRLPRVERPADDLGRLHVLRYPALPVHARVFPS
jgi:hypothetical protein